MDFYLLKKGQSNNHRSYNAFIIKIFHLIICITRKTPCISTVRIINLITGSDDDVKKYFEKIGWDKCKTEYITEFDISISDQIKNKSGEYYDMLKDDDLNLI